MNESMLESAGPDDLQYEGLLESIAGKIETGDSFSLDRYLTDCPHYADRLRKIVPAMQAMFDLGLESAAGLSTAARGTRSAAKPFESINGQLGDFRIVGEIGRGGMGIVYEAEQLSLNRRVALKVLPLASTLDEKHLQRFRNEAYAAASLSHPNIVDAYAVGVERGVHYFAMKYIEGQNLSAVLKQVRFAGSNTAAADDTVRAAAAETDRQQPVSSIDQSNWKNYVSNLLRLFIDAAEALDYAHQQGVVHRDIKPSNLMIDATGRIWVADFGLAQIDRATGMTVTGDLVGTLRYMSPEQAAGERQLQDHRTDIYSLGVTLYEAFALCAAHPETDRMRLLQQVRDGEPEALRSVNPKVPAALQVVIHKAIAREPNRRYARAQDFADDLRRFSEGLTIKAKPPTAGQRLASWSRKHPTALASVVVLMLATMVFSLIGVSLLIGERKKTLQALAEATNQRTEAETRAEESAAVVDFVLNDLFLPADPDRTPGGLLRVDDLMKNAGNSVESDFDQQPRVKASMLHMLGRLNRRLGRYNASKRQLQSSLEIRVNELSWDAPETLDTAFHVVNAMVALDQPEAARRLQEQVLEKRIEVLGTNHPDTFLSEVLLSKILDNLGQREAAEARYRRILYTAADKGIGNELVINQARLGLAWNLRLQDKFTEAESLIRSSVESFSNIAGPKHSFTLEAKRKLAVLLADQMRLDPAEELLLVILEDYREAFGETHPSTAGVLNLLGVIQRRQGDTEAAKRSLQEALRVDTLVYGEGHSQLAGSLNNLAICHQESGEWQKAVEYLEKALKSQLQSVAPEHKSVLSIRHNLARCFLNLSDLKKATEINRDVLGIRQHTLGETHSETIKSMENLADCLRRQGAHDEALGLIRRTHRGRKALYGAGSAITLGSKTKIMEQLFHLGQIGEAKALFVELDHEYVDALGPTHPGSVWAKIRYAQLVSDAGYHLEAALEFREVVELRFSSLGQTHPDTINAIKDFSIIVKRLSPEHADLVMFMLYWTEPKRMRAIPEQLLTKAGPWLPYVCLAI